MRCFLILTDFGGWALLWIDKSFHWLIVWLIDRLTANLWIDWLIDRFICILCGIFVLLANMNWRVWFFFVLTRILYHKWPEIESYSIYSSMADSRYRLWISDGICGVQWSPSSRMDQFYVFKRSGQPLFWDNLQNFSVIFRPWGSGEPKHKASGQAVVLHVTPEKSAHLAAFPAATLLPVLCKRPAKGFRRRTPDEIHLQYTSRCTLKRNFF